MGFYYVSSWGLPSNASRVLPTCSPRITAGYSQPSHQAITQLQYVINSKLMLCPSLRDNENKNLELRGKKPKRMINTSNFHPQTPSLHRDYIAYGA